VHPDILTWRKPTSTRAKDLIANIEPSERILPCDTVESMSGTELSKETHARLVAELEDLTTRGRIDIANAIEAARALGDLKENGDYHAAKDAQGKMEARVRQLQAMLKTAVIVEQGELPVGTVATGSVVAIRYEGDDDVEHYLLGSIEEHREGIAVISPGSPLGLALIHQRVGKIVEYEAPNGTLRVEIVSVD
jgi:transcription elongation factor GreA